MPFKKIRSVRVDYYTQGLIYFLCAAYGNTYRRVRLPEWIKKMIRDVCNDVGRGREGYGSAIFALMTTRKSVDAVSREFYLSKETVYRLRKEFYEQFADRLRKNRLDLKS